MFVLCICYITIETAIEVKNTSSFIYKRNCRKDTIRSSTLAGLVAVGVRAGVFAVILVTDLLAFLRHLQNYQAVFEKKCNSLGRQQRRTSKLPKDKQDVNCDKII